MLTYEMGPGVMRSHTSQLFIVRQLLWKKSNENDVLNPMTTCRFLFTIQMPMIQFPPSMNHDYYSCTYKLSAYLDPSLGYGEIPVMTQIHIKYIPLTETRLLKTPIYLEDLKKKKYGTTSTSPITASVKFYSIEYVSGSTIPATICITSNSNNNISTGSFPSLLPTTADLSITMYLYQVSKFNLDAEPIQEELIATQTHTIKKNKDEKNNGLEQQYPIFIKLNESLPPTFEYSSIMSLTYKLKIKIHLKKIKKPQPATAAATTPTKTTTSATGNASETRDDSSSNSTVTTITTVDHLNKDTKANKKKKKLKKLLTFPWSSAISVFETPIIIGTMGQGIRVGDELKDYSQFDNDAGNPVPTPRFVKNVEYEDTLPKYEASRLPSYGDPSSKSIRNSIRSTRSSIVSAIIMAPATPSITSVRGFT
jgi:hypothetical protein